MSIMEQEPKTHISIPLISGILLGIGVGLALGNQSFSVGFIKTVGVGLLGALCTFFLIFCYSPGNIFGKYMDWLEKNFRDNPNNPFNFLFNPLGGCAYCHNIWVTAFFFLVTNLTIGISWWLLLPALFSSHLFLNILDRLFWR